MDRAYLQWNIVNWLTVVLMAASFMLIVGLVSSALKTYSSGGGSALNNSTLNPNTQD